MKRKIILFTLLVGMLYLRSRMNGQTVPLMFCGENAWMPDSVGTWKIPNARLETNWSNVTQSNVKIIRYGGIAVDSLNPTYSQYIKIIDSVRAKGMEPALQVPYLHAVYDSANARKIIQAINVTNNKHVKYWIIANEPDKYPGSFSSAKNICSYIKKFSIAMKKVDSTIKIIGPEFSRIKPEDTSDPTEKKMDSLTTAADTSTYILGLIPSGNGKASGKAYVDYLSWHVYPWDGRTTTQLRDTVINRIKHVDSMRVGKMYRKCLAANVTRGSYPVYPVITEANVCYYSSGTPPTNDKIDGVKANSFLAGQFWIEYMANAIDRGLQWMNFWSCIEGSALGFMYNNSSAPVKKPTYYHMQQFAQYYNHQGISGSNTTNYVGTSNNAHIKAFGVLTSDQIAVFVLNQDSDKTTNKVYTIRLDNSTITATYWARVNMGLASQIVDTIYGQSTTILLYDCGGNLVKKYRYELKDTANPWKSWTYSGTIYTVDAGADYSVCCPGCTHTFNATPVPNTGTHTYDWYKNGTYVGSGSSYTASGSSSTTNTISVVMYTNGCSTSDYAIMTVGHGASCLSPPPRMANPDEVLSVITEITSIVPNPASDLVDIYYSLAEEPEAELIVLNMHGAEAGRYKLGRDEEKVNIDCRTWVAGVYTAILQVNGRNKNARKLIITK